MRAAAPAFRVTAAFLLTVTGLGACASHADPALGTTTTADTGEPRDGGVVRLGLDGPVVVDPVEANPASPAEMLVLDLLHDGLTVIDPAGEVAPGLAASWSADGTFSEWTFTLREDATFTDGTPITSADVVASLERVAAAGDRSLAARPLETVAGYRAYVDGTVERLEGLTAPDARTVKLRLTRPFNVLPVVLTSPLYGVVHADTSTPLRAAEDVLSGVWQLEANDGAVLTLRRRRGAPGHLDRVEVRAYSNGARAYRALEAGDVDWALAPTGGQRAAVRRFGDGAVAPLHAVVFLGMRVADGPLVSKPLRQAIVAAVDADALVRRVYGDRAAPTRGLVPAGVDGHDGGRCELCGAGAARAKEILASEFPDGSVPEVALDFDETPAQEELAGFVAADLEAAGIPVTLRPKPLAEYQAFLATDGPQLFSAGWIGGYRSAAAYLDPLFRSDGDDNLTGYRNEVVDRALATALSTADPAAAASQLAEVERVVLDDAVVVPIAQFATLAVVGPRVRGLAHAVDGSVDWAEVWVTDTLPNSTSGRGGTGRRAALRSLWE